MFKAPKDISPPKMPKTKYWPDKNYPLNGGLNLADTEFQLNENETNNCLNVWYQNGELDKRWGQKYLNDSEVVENNGHSIYKHYFKGLIVKHSGTKLYTQDPVSGVTTEIYSGLNDTDSRLFKYNSNIYLKQVGKYVQWDGTSASDVVPYIPNVLLNGQPDGSGDTDEDYNRLGTGFQNSFSGDGSTTVWKLTDDELDATLVTIDVDDVTLIENTDFTVNRTTGTITFNIAPSNGTNNIIVKAYKTVQEDIDSILNCLDVKPFGGQNDNRLFFGNNGTGTYYWTGISDVGIDPSYFPSNNYNIVGLDDENITGFGRQQNSLIVIKEREVYAVDYYFDGTIGVFNSYPITDAFGSDCPRSIQTVNNNVVFMSTEFGVCLIQSTNVGNQRNVFSISRNIDLKLKEETNITQASSIEYDGKYWLCFNDKVYVWDFFISPYYDSGNPDDNARRLSWWYFDNINAKSFGFEGFEMFYIDRDTGKTVDFIIGDSSEQYFDFGLGYDALYRYPYRLIGGGLYEFTVIYGNIGVRGDRKTTYSVKYFTNDELNGELEIEPIDVGSFSWDNFNWSLFTWRIMGPMYIWPLRPALKNIQYFAVEFANNEPGKSLNIQSMQWAYTIKKMIK